MPSRVLLAFAVGDDMKPTRAAEDSLHHKVRNVSSDFKASTQSLPLQL